MKITGDPGTWRDPLGKSRQALGRPSAAAQQQVGGAQGFVFLASRSASTQRGGRATPGVAGTSLGDATQSASKVARLPDAN